MTGEGAHCQQLTEEEGYRLLTGYGIPVPRYIVARDAASAGAAAEKIGFPVVMKVISPQIIHKSDAGGVVTAIGDRVSAVQAFSTIAARVRSFDPAAEIAGVMVEQQLPPGLELIVGGKTDPTFGKVLTVGIGGRLVELLGDVSLRVLPADEREIRQMFRELRGYRLIRGYRGEPACDEELLIRITGALARLFLDHPEIAEFDVNPLLLYPDSGCAVDARFIRGDEGPERPVHTEERRPVSPRLFQPSSIAVVGASADPKKIGYAILRNLLPFPGKLYPINPKGGEILGRKAYPSITAVGEKIDAAVIAVPAGIVPQIVEEAGNAGVPLAIIISSGFRESGAGGAALEDVVTGIARRSGMRVMGPNCLGLMLPGRQINTTFDPISPKPGKIAFLSQSGAIITTIVDWSLPEEIGFSAVISVGNQADLGFEEFIEYAAHDDTTKAVILYVEEIRDGATFIGRVRRLSAGKPVVALKSGSSRKGKRAAASHTGSLAGSYEVYMAAFRQAGIVPVEALREAFQTAELLASEGYPKGNRAVVITSAGGFAVLASDYAERFGIDLVELPPDVHAELDAFLPDGWNHGNPIDMIGDATADRFARVYDVLIRHQECWDVAFVIAVPSATVDPMLLANEVVRFSKHTHKMIVGCMIGGDSMKAAFRILRSRNIPNFSDMEDAFKAVGKCLLPVRSKG